MRAFTTLLLVLLAWGFSFAQCPPGELEFQLDLTPDSYPSETSWELTDAGGNVIASGDTTDALLCVPDNGCYTFTINDTYGDGICCAYGQGAYTVLFDGDTVASGGEFQHSEATMFNCPPGSNCNDPLTVQEGAHVAPTADTWYEFVPDSTGVFLITTCGGNTCDTKIWVYDYCQGLVFDNINTGTIYYDDNNGGCGIQAQVNAQLAVGNTYYIRIGTVGGSCTGTIDWSINHNGPIQGCMDPNSCNYNPLASVPDTCYAWGDTLCPGGPDLMVLEDVLETSIYLDTINNADNCMIQEGCIAGYGDREIVRFTTHIKNIGDQDYFIGDPANNPNQFTWDNCHGHNHYAGYAEYVLFDDNGSALPIGFKNGFCVMDLECSGGGTFQYGCSLMGISAGCGDIYGSSLQCQWIDVTDVVDGDYTLAVKVNWDQDPDALGRPELTYDNNWGQVCFNLDRSSGTAVLTVDQNCTPYVDCMGVPYGNAVIDCEGNCNGTALMGDLDLDSAQTTMDAMMYVNEIIGNNITPTTCNDLNADAAITVYDAALMASCQFYGAGHVHPGSSTSHDHCNFPFGFTNVFDTVFLSITNVDFTNSTIDIGIRNPDCRVTAYEFDMSGITIATVDNLVDPQMYPIAPENAFSGVKTIGISYQDSSIIKNVTYSPLCRIHFNSITASEICIEDIIDIVNDQYERAITVVEGGCVTVSSVNDDQQFIAVDVAPNPSSQIFNVEYGLSTVGNLRLEVVNPLGQVIYTEQVLNANRGKAVIDLAGHPNGVYFLNLRSNHSTLTKRIVLTK